jgi:hypothetical protein
VTALHEAEGAFFCALKLNPPGPFTGRDDTAKKISFGKGAGVSTLSDEFVAFARGRRSVAPEEAVLLFGTSFTNSN